MLWVSLDIISPNYYDLSKNNRMSSVAVYHNESKMFEKAKELASDLIKPVATPKEAKKAGFFWLSGADGVGVGLDLLNNPDYVNSLFPGYGPILIQDKKLWSDYFQSEFDPASFISANPQISELGFRVSYSWTGCLDIYEKYGADIIVFGSSEVYKSVIAEQLANNLSPFFYATPKVLFCGTYGMTTETVRMTAQELTRLSTNKPKMIIWGYSFWQSYKRSTLLSTYQKEKNRVFKEHTTRWQNKNEDGIIHQRFSIKKDFKIASIFPEINWDDIFSFSFAKVIAKRAEEKIKLQPKFDQEGIEISSEIINMTDHNLTNYLQNNLKPYYAILNGVSEEDCLQNDAQTDLILTIDGLKKLSPNVYIYVPPTTMHHKKTVPECYIPNLFEIIKKTSKEKEIYFLDAGTEEFGLSDRDFISPLLNTSTYYFDINHTNFSGAQKITRIVSDWIKETMSKLPNLNSK